ncbi:unnamed protein product [Candida verbasci]|uniref:N-terminal acetyltransferase B complex subunit MDM20 n=1 Tax=Candida verbasci TaxID=1227364 RepID=A0A9W4TVF3_9ASCO|nr:unnamed protein product [Candida verbasci]
MISESDQEIIDLVDRGQLTYALSLLNRKLTKFPQKSLYHVLKNKILFKSGKEEESIKQNVAILNQYPSDPMTIDILSNFFQDLDMENESNLAYENIIKRFPANNEKLAKIWFENSIEKYDYKLLNKIFMYLNKESKRDYKMWFILSYYLLIVYGDVDEKSKNLYLTLGLKLISNLEDLNNQEIWVYVQFLRLKEDYEMIEGILSDRELDLELQIIFLETLKLNRSWKKLNEYCDKLLFKENFDDFDTWKLYLLSSKELGVAYGKLKPELPSTRNGLLCAIELDKLFDKSTDSSIETYYDKFNNKLCCYPDLKSYELPSTIIDKIKKANIDSNLITLVNNQKFHKSLDNWDIYSKFKHLPVAEFDSNPLNDLTIESINDLDSVRKVIMLSHLLASDPFNYKLKLYLLQIHSQLNSNDSIIPIYKSLKIKMVQHENLSHTLTFSTFSKDSLSYFIDIFRFYLTSRQEMINSIIDAFNKGVYNKLPSFIKFGSNLKNSISLNFTVYKILQTTFILNDTGYTNYFSNYLLKNKKLIIGEWTDNRDFKTANYARIDTHDTVIKLKLLIYTIIFETKENEVNKLFKFYNKMISHSASFTKFENLIFKLYYNILKIVKVKSNQNEMDSLLNYITKNLKIDKLKQQGLIPENVLSSDMSYNLSNLIELIRIIEFVNKKITSVLRKLNLDQLKSDIKSLELTKLQFDAIDKINFEFPIEFDFEPILTDFKSSIHQSISNLINNI